MVRMNDFEREMVAEWGDHLDVRFYLAARLKRLHGKRVLDVGCGPGLLLSLLPASNSKYGVDLSARRLALARKRNPRAVLKRASMYALPFPNGFFDVVVCANILPGADFPVKGNQQKFQQKMLSEAARVLKKGGILFLTTPNNVWYARWRRSGFTDYAKLEGVLKRHFRCEIKGWNPFPPYPRFLPSRALRKIPVWADFLGMLCEKGFYRRTSKFFYTEAVKQ